MTDTIDVAALVERLKPRWIADAQRYGLEDGAT